jgi:predicted AlkP superfamily phosphohydrolase/phosphomutase
MQPTARRGGVYPRPLISEKQLGKVVVLGLDGVSWSLLWRLAAEGVMPNMAALLAEASAGPMLSTLPEISPVAWTSFFTARAPGDHGIYGFTDFEPGKYELRFNSSADVKAPCVWDRLSLGGRRSVVLNVPLTYPARPLDGVMVSGFVALDYERAVYPPALAGFLREIGYRLEADFERAHRDRPAFLDDLSAALEGRGRLLDEFWPYDWDFFALVVTDTDRLLHFFLREFLENGPIAEYFLSFFRRVDALVGRVVEKTAQLADRTGRPIDLIMLSDHGFAPVKGEFHLNRWLAANGFQAETLSAATALALDPTRIYLNRPARFHGGRVSQAEGESVMTEITARLSREEAVAGVARGAVVYSGSNIRQASDLVVLPQAGWEFKAKFDQGSIYTGSPLQGTHTFDDAFYLVRRFGAQSTEECPAPSDVHALGRVMFDRLGV